MKRILFGPNVILGADASDWQIPSIPWDAFRAMGGRFATIKTTEGMYYRASHDTDHIKGARAAGLIIGVYHFYRFGIDPIEQAKNFYGNSEYTRNDLPPTIDDEWSDGRQILTNQDARPLLTMFQETEKLFGETPIHYTADSFFSGVTDPGLLDAFKRYIPWICDINSPLNELRSPDIYDKVMFRQHTFDLIIPGYTGGKLDGDLFNGTEEELRAFAENRTTPSAPQPPITTPIPVNAVTKEEVIALQIALNHVNTSTLPMLVVDGIPGPKTSALLKWESENLALSVK